MKEFELNFMKKRMVCNLEQTQQDIKELEGSRFFEGIEAGLEIGLHLIYLCEVESKKREDYSYEQWLEDIKNSIEKIDK